MQDTKKMTNPPRCCIGYAADEDVRYKSASGGITTAIISYLFSTGQIQTMLACHFDVGECQYVPKFIYSYDEYEMVGSVYQDMDVIGYIRSNISKINGRILVVCAPCQVKAIRSLLNRSNIESVIIDYFCSGQTIIEGTYCYYRFLGINRNDVVNIRYRGNGWPNGIEVTLKNGEKIKKNNYTEPWKTIHTSGLFKPKRCHYCKLAESIDADVSVGDPWVKEYKDDTIGHTLFLVHTSIGEKVINDMFFDRKITYKEVDYSLFKISQKPNIDKAVYVQCNKKFINQFIKVKAHTKYFKWATRDVENMHKHIRYMNLMRKVYNILNRSLMDNFYRLTTKIGHKIKPSEDYYLLKEESRWTGA